MALRLALSTLFLVTLATPAAAQHQLAIRLPALPAADSGRGAATASEVEEREPWSRWGQATGGWGGLRPALASAGLEIEAAYVYDLSANGRGGLRRDGVGRGLLTAGLHADLETVAGLPGAAVFAGMFTHGGPNGSDLAGDIQAFSNIDAGAFLGVAEVWYEQQLFGDRLRLKAGQVDANSEFAVVEPAGEFINASAGFSPTIYGLPTYPEPAPSLNAFLQPVSWLSLGGGVYRGPLANGAGPRAETGAAFVIAEGVGSWPGGRLVAGYWRHPGGYAPVFSGGTQRGPKGWYAALEQRLSGVPATEDSAARGVVVFAKYGAADDRISEFGRHLMLGLVREAPFGRPEDAVGMMASHVDLSDHAGAGYAGNETAFELFYRLPALGFLTLRPDLQYIVAPSGARGVPDAFVGTLRAEVTF